MHNDEERLYDPNDDDFENGVAQNIDATSTTTETPQTTPNGHDDSNSSCNSDSTLPSVEGQQVIKHRFFILEPAVFLVFLAMYLSGKITILVDHCFISSQQQQFFNLHFRYCLSKSIAVSNLHLRF